MDLLTSTQSPMSIETLLQETSLYLMIVYYDVHLILSLLVSQLATVVVTKYSPLLNTMAGYDFTVHVCACMYTCM